MELISANVNQNAVVEWVADEGLGEICWVSYQPEGGVFVPDGASVSLDAVGVPSETPPFGTVRDCLAGVFSASGVSADRSRRLAEVLAGVPPSELQTIVKVSAQLAQTFGGRRLPDDGASFTGVSFSSPSEAVRGLLQGNSGPVTYVLPSQLIDFARSVSVVETHQRDDSIILSAVGNKNEFVSVKPMHDWTNADVDAIVTFLNKMGGRVVSFAPVLERIARAVFRLQKYAFPHGDLEMGHLQDAAGAVRGKHVNILLRNGPHGPEFKPEVSNLLARFREAVSPYSVPVELRDKKPHLLACMLLRSSVTRLAVITAFSDYCKLLPTPFLSGIGQFVLPPCDQFAVVTEACVRPHLAATAEHPLADPIPGSVFGRTQGRVGEVMMTLDLLGVFQYTNDVFVVTGQEYGRLLREQGLTVQEWLRASAWPRESHVLRGIGNQHSCVVVTRGDCGGVNDMPSSVSDIGDRNAELARIVEDICVTPPRFIAVCGPYPSVAIDEIPEWVRILGNGYTLKAIRPCMGSVPMFWVHGVYRGHVMSGRELKDLMRDAYRDLQLSLAVRDAMALSGRSSFPLLLEVVKVGEESALRFEDKRYVKVTQSAQDLATFLWSKLRLGPSLRRAENRSSLGVGSVAVGMKVFN